MHRDEYFAGFEWFLFECNRCAPLPCRLLVPLTLPPTLSSRRLASLAHLVEASQQLGVKVTADLQPIAHNARVHVTTFLKVELVDEAVWIENTTLSFHVDDDEPNADHGSRYAVVNERKVATRMRARARSHWVTVLAVCLATTQWFTRMGCMRKYPPSIFPIFWREISGRKTQLLCDVTLRVQSMKC
jgi:hypothetical protein